MLKTLKDLEKAIKLCRKLGIHAIEIGDVKFELGAMPQTMPAARRVSQTLPGVEAPGGITEEVLIPTTPAQNAAQLTEEQLLFYSVGGEQQ